MGFSMINHPAIGWGTPMTPGKPPDAVYDQSEFRWARSKPSRWGLC